MVQRRQRLPRDLGNAVVGVRRGKLVVRGGEVERGVNPTAWLDEANITRGTPARRAASNTCTCPGYGPRRSVPGCLAGHPAQVDHGVRAGAGLGMRPGRSPRPGRPLHQARAGRRGDVQQAQDPAGRVSRAQHGPDPAGPAGDDDNGHGSRAYVAGRARSCPVLPQTRQRIEVSGDCGGLWCLMKSQDRWLFSKDLPSSVKATIIIPQSIAWRIFTKGIDGETARSQVTRAGTKPWPHTSCNWSLSLADCLTSW